MKCPPNTERIDMVVLTFPRGIGAIQLAALREHAHLDVAINDQVIHTLPFEAAEIENEPCLALVFRMNFQIPDQQPPALVSCRIRQAGPLAHSPLVIDCALFVTQRLATADEAAHTYPTELHHCGNCSHWGEPQGSQIVAATGARIAECRRMPPRFLPLLPPEMKPLAGPLDSVYLVSSFPVTAQFQSCGEWTDRTAGGRDPLAAVTVEYLGIRPFVTAAAPPAPESTPRPNVAWQRCPMCDGTGRTQLGDGYCTCALGADLRRLESRRQEN